MAVWSLPKGLFEELRTPERAKGGFTTLLQVVDFCRDFIEAGGEETLVQELQYFRVTNASPSKQVVIRPGHIATDPSEIVVLTCDVEMVDMDSRQLRLTVSSMQPMVISLIGMLAANRLSMLWQWQCMGSSSHPALTDKFAMALGDAERVFATGDADHKAWRPLDVVDALLRQGAGAETQITNENKGEEDDTKTQRH